MALVMAVVEYSLHAGKCSQQKGLRAPLMVAPVKHLRLNVRLFHSDP